MGGLPTALINAYGTNSLTWPEEIKYTYAVCFNRIVGEIRQANCTHPAFPTTVPFDLSTFDRGSLRTDSYACPRSSQRARKPRASH